MSRSEQSPAIGGPASSAGASRPTVAVDLRALVPQATGVGVLTRSLLVELAARRRARFLGLSHRPPRDAAGLTAAGIELEHQRSLSGVVWQQLALPRRLAAGDVDLLWSPVGTLPLVCPVPAVVTINDLTPLLLPETHRLKVRLSQLPFLRPTLDKARRIAAISRATADDLAFHFPECADRVRVVRCGIDPAFRPAEPSEIEAVRREIGFPDGYLLYAGTVEPRKNVATLLDAWEVLRAEDREATPPLVLAGGGGWKNRPVARRIQRLTEAGLLALGRVEQSRLVRLVQGATGFVYPSLYEGFGLPPAEAMACRVPVIVSDSSSLPEVVGDAGWIVPAESVEALAAAIRELIDDPERAARRAERGLERSRRFTWAAAADGMEALFAEALAS